ncbi:hypothetical protein L3X38_023389 [Prunus dulcis]|uniref:Uncharacterized protein n=1 Tax=Prunus dulcis TaxID=3755 RepID=A0AAD4VZE0_PRUDU|nr:hypothetical protein L3X38_023389 [Prunus dulcis]
MRFSIQYVVILKQSNWVWQQGMGARGVIGDRWSMRILWACAIGSAASLYMVAAERQAQNRQRMLAEELKAMEAESGNGERMIMHKWLQRLVCAQEDLGNVKTLFDLLMKEEQAEKLRTRLIVVVVLFSQKVHDSGLKQLTNRQSSIGLLVILCLTSLSNAHKVIKFEAPAGVNRKIMDQDKPVGQGFGSGVGTGTGTGTGVGIGKGIGSGGNGVGIEEGYGIGTGSGYGEGTGIGIGRGSGNGGFGEGRGIGIGTGDGGYGEGRGVGIGTGSGGYGPGNGPWASGPGYGNSGGSGFGYGVGIGTGSGSGGNGNNCGGGCNPGCECPGACFQPGQPNGLTYNKPTQHEQMTPTKMGAGEPITPNTPPALCSSPPDSPDSSTKTANEAHHHSAVALHN